MGIKNIILSVLLFSFFTSLISGCGKSDSEEVPARLVTGNSENETERLSLSIQKAIPSDGCGAGLGTANSYGIKLPKTFFYQSDGTTTNPQIICAIPVNDLQAGDAVFVQSELEPWNLMASPSGFEAAIGLASTATSPLNAYWFAANYGGYLAASNDASSDFIQTFVKTGSYVVPAESQGDKYVIVRIFADNDIQLRGGITVTVLRK